MKQALDNNKLTNFLNAVQNTAIRDISSSSNMAVIENALIIIEDKTAKFADILKLLKLKNTQVVDINDSNESESFTYSLISANKKGKLLIINLECDPLNDMITILKQLSEDNEFSVIDNDKLKFRRLNPATRIIVCAKRLLIEEKVTYPYFYELFGPVLVI